MRSMRWPPRTTDRGERRRSFTTVLFVTIRRVPARIVSYRLVGDDQGGAAMTEVHGTCEPAFEGVRAALVANLEQGKDVGASAAVTVDGRLVADVWGGHQDPERTTPWLEDTLVNVWSTTKTMAALSMLVLADRGELDVDAPVASYWPEFKANGKENIAVRHLMSHTAGLSGWQEPMTGADLYDWEKCT